MRAIAIAFETANERRTSPCAIGLAWIDDGVVTRRAYTLVRPPEMRFAFGNVRIHGIRPEDVRGAPELPDAIAPFMPDLVGRTILAQNAGFDIAVLCGTLAAYGLAVPRLTYLCTRALGRRAWPGDRRHGLAAMAQRIGLSFTHHHAGEDAYACARIALAAAAAAGTQRIGEAAERLGVRPGFVDWPSTVACSSARPVEARPREIRLPPPRPGAGRLTFTMRGSRGDRYEIVGHLAGRDGYALRCSCTAGQHRRRCRHVTALLDGEITDLVSENVYDVEKLRVVVQAIGDAAILPAAIVRPRGDEGVTPGHLPAYATCLDL